jgi:nitrite reductase (NO-forming)
MRVIVCTSIVAALSVAFLGLLASKPPGIGAHVSDELAAATGELRSAATVTRASASVRESSEATGPVAPGVQTAAVPQGAPGAGSAADGRAVFRKCQGCHTMDAGRNLVGPSLAQIVGKTAGTAAGFSFSPAMKSSGVVWNRETLSAYLANPQGFMPGNRMMFPGLKAARELDAVVAYLADPSTGSTTAVAAHSNHATSAPTAETQRPVASADLSRDPSDLPAPIGKRPPRTIRVDLETVEREGRLADGASFGFWTFNGKVPGPFLRVRVGDTIEVNLKNAHDSTMIHSVDFHAATGPGGGAAALQVDPGDAKSVRLKALAPGLFVYHCATPMVAQHIANGMYGLILVEPEGGLPPVDREFYVMQGEIYTDAPYGRQGGQGMSVEKLLNERPEYFVFNGSVGALTTLHPMHAKVGETVRIFFGVGGPNFTSSFHVIGEIFDRVYSFADLVSPPLRSVQTVPVPAGGAVVAEFKLDVPGRYILVDHALSRAERGLVGVLAVEGQANPAIFDGKVGTDKSH